ncbi:cytochrome P450 [uncultured Shewanella sp.]|uniref:cytochrome P450 n=1 Tax=uncultured Shewanella sp. TaxID=173975 RepID=UPI00260C94B0|nr:cytochrome P450 [uncultured Shewanella sp.]
MDDHTDVVSNSHSALALNTQSQTDEYDLSSMNFISNPFETYRTLLQQAPIYQSPTSGHYYISKPDYIEHILKNNQAFSSDRVNTFTAALPPEQIAFIQPLINGLSKWLLFQDPPKHMPLRRIINASLKHKLLMAIEPEIKQLTQQLIQTMKQEQQNDIIQGLAYPLPALVIARLLGVPASDIHLIKKWSDDIAQFMGSTLSASSAIKAQESIIDMADYLTNILNNQTVCESTTVLGNIIQYQQDSSDFTLNDVIANCIMLLFAGHETTTNLISNLWQQLQSHPSQLQQLIDNPALIKPAIEESLRYDGAVHRLGRLIAKDTLIGNTLLKKGHRVFLMLGAAHRCPERYSSPDTFDIHRKPKQLGFGFGPHICPGAALGRLEAEIAIAALIEHFPQGSIIEPPQYINNLGLRAMKSLKIKL